MKQVIQLDAAGYFVGATIADESPLEPGVFLLPAGTVDADAPVIPEGKKAKWDGAWVFEDIPQPEPIVEPEPVPITYQELRAAAYPSMADQLDLLYHGGMDAWKAAITAVKEEFPK